MALDKKYFDFHGKNTRKRRDINFHVPKKGLVKLGKATAIEYECSKIHGGGDGKRAVYRHEFETPVYVYADERMKKQLYIIGERLRVTDAGIEH